MLIGFGGGRRAPGQATGLVNQNTARGFASAKMRRYAVAVDIVANRLNQHEREVLRSTGEVPDWFLADVLAEARKVKFR